MNRRYFLSSSIVLGAATALFRLPIVSGSFFQTANSTGMDSKKIRKVIKTDAEWKSILKPEQYYVTRQKGTEAPYSSPLNDIHEQGIFECVCCALPLFSSKNKFDSGTGWPSFWAPIAKENVREEIDNSLAETRTGLDIGLKNTLLRLSHTQPAVPASKKHGSTEYSALPPDVRRRLCPTG